jgi:CBS domain-containing protein
MTTQFKHPILRLDVLASDGTRQTEHRVFCRLQRQSVLVDDCCSCVHCDAISDGTTAAATVDCTMPMAPDDPASDPTGERTEIGTLLCTGTIVVGQSTSLSSALAVLHAEDRRAVAIVDENHAIVGMVHETAFIGRRVADRAGAVSVAMSSAIAVNERTPVRVALRLLAASHLREATVVSDAGVPIGVFRDVDGLHWIAAARDASCE